MTQFPQESFSYLCSSCELVKDMIVSFFTGLEGDSWLLKQVVLDETALDLELAVETNLHEATEARRVVISDRLGISCKQSNNIH